MRCSPTRLVPLAVLAALLPAAAPALDLEGAAELDSAYVWRGMVVNDRPVLEPSLTASAGGFSASVWANVDLTADNGARGVASEVDYWAAYTLAARTIDWTLTAYAYTFPHSSAASTQEIWLNATFKTLPFSPSLSAIRDLGTIRGWYVLLSGSRSLGVARWSRSDGLLLTLNAGHGNGAYCRGYLPDAGLSGATDLGARLDWPLRVGPGTLTLHAQYTTFTEEAANTDGAGHRPLHVAGGLAYAISL